MESVQILRRSSKKRAASSALTSVFSSSTKKARKLTTHTALPSVPAPTLTTLPHVVTVSLLLHLDVDTLENLSATCSYFDQLIAGRFLTSITFPFSEHFLTELMASSTLEKKPLLKIRCLKPHSFLSEIAFIQSSFSSFNGSSFLKESSITKHLVLSQLVSLSLHQLREMDLVPAEVRSQLSHGHNLKLMNWYSVYDKDLMGYISR